MADTLVAIDENLKQNPNLDLAQLVYSYEYHSSLGLTTRATELQEEIMAMITADKMLPYYQQVAAKFSWPIDEALAATLKADNEAALHAIEASYEDAVENHGDMEVRNPPFLFNTITVPLLTGCCDWTHTGHGCYVRQGPPLLQHRRCGDGIHVL